MRLACETRTCLVNLASYPMGFQLRREIVLNDPGDERLGLCFC